MKKIRSYFRNLKLKKQLLDLELFTNETKGTYLDAYEEALKIRNILTLLEVEMMYDHMRMQDNACMFFHKTMEDIILGLETTLIHQKPPKSLSRLEYRDLDKFLTAQVNERYLNIVLDNLFKYYSIVECDKEHQANKGRLLYTLNKDVKAFLFLLESFCKIGVRNEYRVNQV